MKCSHQGDFIIILLIILTANDKGKAFVLFSDENRSFDKNSEITGVSSASKNTLQDLDLFPTMNNFDIPKHRIVKKQMAISDENQLLGKYKNRLVDKEKSFSIDPSSTFKDNNVNIASGFNSWMIQKLNEHETPIPRNDERERFVRLPKEIMEENSKQLSAIKWNKFRLKRDLLMKKKGGMPDTNSDPDSEPYNEWTDASQGNNQKIPAEFKPKPKLKLKIFHLNGKREPKNHEMESTVGKRQTWNRFMFPDAARRAFHPAKVYPTRLHPRSFVVRIKKKGDNKSKHEEKKNEPEKQQKDDEEDDEDSEEDEDDQDDEEEDEETEYEDTDEESVSITPKPDRKDAIKEFFKTAKEAVINRAKFDDGFVSGSLKSEGGKESLTPSKNEKEEGISEKSKKVLIDANIKFDGAISRALKGLLGYRKDKISENKENNAKLIRENELQENINVKNTNNENHFTGISEHPLQNNQRKKRYLLSLLNKKNRDSECLEKGGLVSVDSLINCINSEYDREELLQKLQQIKYKDPRLNRYDLLVK